MRKKTYDVWKTEEAVRTTYDCANALCSLTDIQKQN